VSFIVCVKLSERYLQMFSFLVKRC